MAKYFIYILMLSLGYFPCAGQMNYCNSKKPTHFYWDWHQEYKYNVPIGVSKEIIYHQSLRGTDSVLEKEIYYNQQGLPVLVKQYAAPTKEGLISTDSLFYDEQGLLTRSSGHSKNCVIGNEYTEVQYEYDQLHREITKIVTGTDAEYRETIYNTNTTLQRLHYPNGDIDTSEIHFYHSGTEDSAQISRYHQWLYTTVFVYDTVKKTKETYLRYYNGKLLRSRFQYNPDGTVHTLLIKNLPNWNQTKISDVESEIRYNTDKSVRECIFYLNGKEAFVKKHIYQYY